MKARSFAPALVVLGISALVTGCFIVTSPPPENAETAPAATTATATAQPTAQPTATEEPKKVAVPKIFPGAPPADSSTPPAQ